MNTQNKSYPLRMPKSMVIEAKEIASQDGVSLNQFICYAVAEKMSALKAIKYVNDRAENADEIAFKKIMANVPDVEPVAEDRP